MASNKKIKRRSARRAIYVDFEGRTGEDPVLLGVLYDTDPEGVGAWRLEQRVIDPSMSDVNDAANTGCLAQEAGEALAWLIDRSDDEQRPLVSWSNHDRRIAQGLTNDQAFRFRNAITTAKPWRREQREKGAIEDDVTVGNALRHYEKLIGYSRPAERYKVGTSIKYIRELKSVTRSAIERWRCIVDHNQHDLLAMRDVVFTVKGLDPPK